MKKRKSLFGVKSKKGNAILEGATILIVITIFALASIFGYLAFDDLNADIVADADFSDEAEEVSTTLHGKYVDLLDNLFLFMFVLFVLFSIISAYMIDTKPILFAFTIILLICLLVAAPLIANSYDDVVSEEEIASYANEFTYMGWVMSHLLELMIAVGFIIAIVIYIKLRG